MLDNLDQIEREALSSLESVQDEDALQSWKVANLGRSSPLMGTFDQLREVSKEERPAIGRRANEVKQALESAYQAREDALRRAAIQTVLESDRLDITLPGRPLAYGRLHPSTQTMREMYSVLADMGFQVYRSREVESDEFNFQLLNFPLHHPAARCRTSYYIDTGTDRGDNPLVLRTHTSPGQIHAMREFSERDPENPPPIRIILPGMCFRYEQVTARRRCNLTRSRAWRWDTPLHSQI